MRAVCDELDSQRAKIDRADDMDMLVIKVPFRRGHLSRMAKRSPVIATLASFTPTAEARALTDRPARLVRSVTIRARSACAVTFGWTRALLIRPAAIQIRPNNGTNGVSASATPPIAIKAGPSAAANPSQRMRLVCTSGDSRPKASSAPRTAGRMRSVMVAARLTEAGALTMDVMREIGTQAAALGVPLEDLPPELKNIVTWLNRTAPAARDYIDALQDAKKEAQSITETTGAQILAARDLGVSMEEVSKKFGISTDALKIYLGSLNDLGESADEATEQLRTLRAAEDALLVTSPTLTLSWDEMLSVGQKLGPEIHGMTLGTIEAIPSTIALADAFAHLKTEAPEALAKTQGFFTGVAQGFQDLWKGISGGQGISGLLKNIGSGLSEGLGQILSGGIASAINAAVGLASKGLKKIGGFFKRLFGGPSEAELAGRKTAWAFRDGVIATLNDAQLAEAAQAALGDWRGNERGVQFLIGVRDAYLAVGKSAADAERDVTRLWQAEKRGPEAVQAVQRELQVVLDQAADLTREMAQGLEGIRAAGHAAFDPAQLDPYLAQLQEAGLLTAAQAAEMRQLADDAHTDWQAMEEAARTYGVAMKTVVDEAGNETQVLDESLLGLGHAQAKLTDEAGRLAAAWDLLTGEGARTGAAIRGMTDEAQGFVTKALEMGIALPAAMQPMIEKMIEHGRLTDLNSEKLTDLSGLTFAEPLAEKFDTLITKLTELIEKIAGRGGVTQTIDAIPTDIDIGVGFNVERLRLPDVGSIQIPARVAGLPSLQHGGLVTRPTLAQLHPPEAVVPLPRMDTFGGGGRRVEAKLDQLHQDFALLLDEFRHGLDPRRRERALVAAAALSTS